MHSDAGLAGGIAAAAFATTFAFASLWPQPAVAGPADLSGIAADTVPIAEADPSAWVRWPQPEPAPAHKPIQAPAVLYAALEGVTLTRLCGDGQKAHSARNCTNMVEGFEPVEIPAFGNTSRREAIVQQLADLFEGIGVRVTDERPPDYFPYTMAVMGGSDDIVDRPEPICGLATLTCGSQKRNPVSLTFAHDCPDTIASIAAQESAHNFGLEHVNEAGDVMYPTAGTNRKVFTDGCLPMTDGTDSYCDFEHVKHCPPGEQDAVTELLAAFGPAIDDTTAPELTHLSPADGAVIHPDDGVTVSAELYEETEFVGVQWRWLAGPDGDRTETRCTNDMCEQGYTPGVQDPETAWPFLTLDPGAPEGLYRFEFEAMDAAGNVLLVPLSFTLSEDAAAEGGGVTSGEGDADAGSTDDGSDAGTGSGSPATEPTHGGCSCHASDTDAGAAPLALLLLAPGLAFRSRRRSSRNPH